MKNENKKEKKVFQLILGEDDMVDGVSKISLVEYPAHESDFMVFSKESRESYKFAEDGGKRIVTGAALIPNIEIPRIDDNGDVYYVFFDEKTIEKCQELYFKRSQHNSSNIDHVYDVDGVTTIESWIITDPKNDKSSALGFQNLPKGTWMISNKINNENLWKELKEGNKINGFSIEGNFIEELVEMNKTEEDSNTSDEIKKVITNDKLTVDEMYDAISNLIDIDVKKSENNIKKSE